MPMTVKLKRADSCHDDHDPSGTSFAILQVRRAQPARREIQEDRNSRGSPPGMGCNRKYDSRWVLQCVIKGLKLSIKAQRQGVAYTLEPPLLLLPNSLAKRHLEVANTYEKIWIGSRGWLRGRGCQKKGQKDKEGGGNIGVQPRNSFCPYLWYSRLRCLASGWYIGQDALWLTKQSTSTGTNPCVAQNRFSDSYTRYCMPNAFEKSDCIMAFSSPTVHTFMIVFGEICAQHHIRRIKTGHRPCTGGKEGLPSDAKRNTRYIHRESHRSPAVQMTAPLSSHHA